MVCPMRIIVIAVSAVVAVALGLIAVLSDEEIIASPDSADQTKEQRSLGWQMVDFVNGKFLWRQYVRCRGTKNKANKENKEKTT